MKDASSNDSVHTSIGFGMAATPGALVPDVNDPAPQAREYRQALRDPAFARKLNLELRAQTILAIIATLCFLTIFFFLGYLVTSQISLVALATACVLIVIPLGFLLPRDASAQVVEVVDEIESSPDT
jgi:hypothetical protein